MDKFFDKIKISHLQRFVSIILNASQNASSDIEEYFWVFIDVKLGVTNRHVRLI